MSHDLLWQAPLPLPATPSWCISSPHDAPWVGVGQLLDRGGSQGLERQGPLPRPMGLLGNQGHLLQLCWLQDGQNWREGVTGLEGSGGRREGWQLDLCPEYSARTWSGGVRAAGSGLQWSASQGPQLHYALARQAWLGKQGNPQGCPQSRMTQGHWREAVRWGDPRNAI